MYRKSSEKKAVTDFSPIAFTHSNPNWVELTRGGVKVPRTSLNHKQREVFNKERKEKEETVL